MTVYRDGMSDEENGFTKVTWRAPNDILARLDTRAGSHPDHLSRNEWLNRMVVYVLDNIDFDPSGVRKQHTYVNEAGGAPQ